MKDEYLPLTAEDQELLCNPDTLFHYTTYETFSSHIFLESRLRFSNIRKTNDPNEYKFVNVSVSNTDHPFDSIVLGANDEVGSIRNKMCVGCFCKNVKNCIIVLPFGDTSPKCGFAHSRMWSQYGQDHRGVCLAFDKKQLINDINDICDDKTLFFHKAITYKN